MPSKPSAQERTDVLFTDLDGTLLDHHTYRPGPALPALRQLRDAGVLVLPATAKTLAEVRQIGAELAFRDEGARSGAARSEGVGAFDGAIVENGAAVALPPHFPDHLRFPDQLQSPDQLPGAAADDLTVLGVPYPVVRGLLADAAAEAGAGVRGYGDMTAEEVAAETGLTPAEARRAQARQWSETFLLTSGDPEAVGAALKRRGLRAVRGARFLTAMGEHDKGEAARLVLRRLRRDGREVRSWAVGDAANDTELLAAVDHALLVRAGDGDWADLGLPGLIRLDGVGPAGWARIPSLLSQAG